MTNLREKKLRRRLGISGIWVLIRSPVQIGMTPDHGLEDFWIDQTDFPAISNIGKIGARAFTELRRRIVPGFGNGSKFSSSEILFRFHRDGSRSLLDDRLSIGRDDLLWTPIQLGVFDLFGRSKKTVLASHFQLYDC